MIKKNTDNMKVQTPGLGSDKKKLFFIFQTNLILIE